MECSSVDDVLFMIVARVSTIVDDGGAVVGFMFGVQNQ